MNIGNETWICVDCTLILANDDASGMSEKRELEVRAGFAKQNVPLALTGERHDFATAPCDVCECVLSGERHEVVSFSSPRGR